MKAIPITAASCTGKFEEENTTGKGEVLEYEMEELPVALQEASKNTSWQVPNFTTFLCRLSLTGVVTRRVC